MSRTISRRPRAAGFSMVEVMVAFAVVCVGLLGVAKLQALSLSSTTLASARSLAALETEGLAAMMHANRGYWTSAAPAAVSPIVVQSTVAGPPVISAGPLAAAATCTTAGGMTPCSPTTLAAADLQNWASSLQALLPGYQATITCGTTSPVSCTITITWTENTVALNKQESAAQAAGVTLQAPIYTLYVTP